MRQPACAHMQARWSSRRCPECVVEERAALATGEQAWFDRTGHCGACGQPGSYCTCTQPCGCSQLHPVGSGLTEDALDSFAAAAPICDDQGELFTTEVGDV